MVCIESIDVGDVALSQRVWRGGRPIHPPVVLLPATGETAADWDGIAAELSRDRLVRAVDLRGHGASGWPGRYSLQLMADDIIGLLRRCDETPDLVGHSLGGLVACIAASAVPDRIRKLVLEDVPLPHPRPPAPPSRPSGPLDFDWRVVEQVRPEIDAPDPAWPDVVGRITVPTLVIAGGPSSGMPQRHVAELAGALPNGRLETIDGGHRVHAARPGEFLRCLTAFLAASS